MNIEEKRKLAEWLGTTNPDYWDKINDWNPDQPGHCEQLAEVLRKLSPKQRTAYLMKLRPKLPGRKTLGECDWQLHNVALEQPDLCIEAVLIVLEEK